MKVFLVCKDAGQDEVGGTVAVFSNRQDAVQAGIDEILRFRIYEVHSETQNRGEGDCTYHWAECRPFVSPGRYGFYVMGHTVDLHLARLQQATREE